MISSHFCIRAPFQVAPMSLVTYIYIKKNESIHIYVCVCVNEKLNILPLLTSLRCRLALR